MAVTFASHVENSGGAAITSLVLTLPTATVAGDIALVATHAGVAVTAVSGLGATWSAVETSTVGGTPVALWVGTGCTAGNTSITVTTGSATAILAGAAVVSGAAGVLLHGKTAYTNTTPCTVCGLTATASGQMCVAFRMLQNTGQDGPLSSGNLVTQQDGSWTIDGDVYRSASNWELEGFHHLSAGANTQTLTVTNGNSWASLGFFALLGSPPPPPAQPSRIVGAAVMRAAVI